MQQGYCCCTLEIVGDSIKLFLALPAEKAPFFICIIYAVGEIHGAEAVEAVPETHEMTKLMHYFLQNPLKEKIFIAGSAAEGWIETVQ